jgi:hypothetical protein
MEESIRSRSSSSQIRERRGSNYLNIKSAFLGMSFARHNA